MNTRETQQSQPRSFEERMTEMFPTSYLALMTIVQGVALASLANHALKYYQSFHSTAWLLCIATAVIIVLTWHEYALGVGLFTWVPRLPDAFIPFLLCASELALAATVGDFPASWCLAFAAFAVASLAAFLNMYGQASNCKNADYKRNLLMLQKIGWYRPLTLALIAALGIVFLVLGLAFRQYVLAQPEFPVSVALFALLLWIMRTRGYFKRCCNPSQGLT